jgi:hypothetical protein
VVFPESQPQGHLNDYVYSLDPNWRSIEEWCDWEGKLCVICKEYAGNGVVRVTLAENTKTGSAWSSGYTGFDTESTPTVVAWKNMLNTYSQEQGGLAVRRLTSPDGYT